MPEQQLSDSLRHRIHKEFSRPILKNWDWQFIRLLGVILLCETILITFMALMPEKEYSQKDIARIQEQYAKFIIAREEHEAQKPPPVSTGIGTGVEETRETEGEEETRLSERPSETAETRRGPGEDTGDGRPGGREAVRSTEQRQAVGEIRRKETREAASRSVSTKGLLGMLTGSGSTAQGEAVDDVLSGYGSGNGMNHDLDQILSSVDGLQTQGGRMGGPGGSASGIGGVRGSRSGERTSIDDLVTEGSDMATASMSRQGDLYMESPTDVVGRGSKSAYRSPDAIREVLLSHVPAVRYCYERELKRDSELKGKISVRITIGADGDVTDAEILSSTLNNSRVERCILGRIRFWKDFKPIDPTEGEVTFRQVYTFGV